MSDLGLRDALPEERGTIRALTLMAYSEYATVMSPAAWAGLNGAVRAALETEEPGVQRIVAERGGEIVGSVMLYPPQADAYGDLTERAGWPELRLLAVAPSERGRGVGQALVEECVRRARRLGADDLGLHTSDSLAAAVRMYERMGFIRAPAHDFRPGGGELVMAYRLPLGDFGAV